MDLQAVLSAISTVGFPIICVIAMSWYVKYITDKNREQIETMNEAHKNEIDEVTKALNNNTLALQRLTDHLEGKE